ncbi:MAG: HAMP domain-containing histidine kinase [Acidobacteriota bacterium]|nr:HAMP domain-containing histidine kinase [Acidobacteriota bacterium]
MARKCFMCGSDVTEGILCSKCDKPRKKSTPDLAATHVPAPQATPAQESKPPQVSREATAPVLETDPFPKAPVLPFPVESATPAITSVVNLLVASGVASVLVGPDRSVKFVSDEAKRLFGATQSELATVAAIEAKAGVRVGELSLPVTAGVRIGTRNFIYTLVPMSGGASGAVLMFRHSDPMNESHASFATYVRETVFTPLRTLRESLTAAARSRNDHFLADTADAIDQILSSLELAPDVDEPSSARPVPTVTEVVHRVAERFRAHGDLKGIRLDVDAPELEERIADHEQLAEALAILMENALHYVPAGGQVVIGARWMEHKGKPLLLFFVMDNGPVVPESMRQVIFEPSFVWNAGSAERTGRGLFKCREFAVAHAGSLWVESKTGKACTFFLRVRPDGVR